MSLAQLLADHGYVAVFIASLLEGETILVLAGFAAHQGLLSLPLTLTLAFSGRSECANCSAAMTLC